MSENKTVLILTALVEEHRAIVEVFTGSKARNNIDEELSLTRGSYNLHLVCLNDMGNTNSAACTAYNISKYNPVFVILSGICGGIRGKDLKLGDVIVAEQIIAYEASKLVPRVLNFGSKAVRRLQTYRAGHSILNLAKHTSVERWPDNIVQHLKADGRKVLEPAVLVGPIASGEKVVANKSFLKPIRKAYPTLKGIEMEGGGVSLSVHKSPNSCEGIVVKSVCDWADHTKNDDWHVFSSYASAYFVKNLVDNISDGHVQATSSGLLPRSLNSNNGIFIEFLNPESQRIYDLAQETTEGEKRLAANTVIKASILLNPNGIVFPVGTFLEAEYLMSMIKDLTPLISAGFIKFSMREKTIEQFLKKRRIQYRGLQKQYPTLFIDTPGVDRLFPKESILSKENFIGKRIAEEFVIGPNNLKDWKKVSAIYSTDEINKISEVPSLLASEGRAVTWSAFKAKLNELSIVESREIRILLQATYCKIYASEYGLEFLQSVSYAPFSIIPVTQNRRYDYQVLKRVLKSIHIWEDMMLLSPEDFTQLMQTKEYASFIVAYDKVFNVTLNANDIDRVLRELRSRIVENNTPESSQSRESQLNFLTELLDEMPYD